MNKAQLEARKKQLVDEGLALQRCIKSAKTRGESLKAFQPAYNRWNREKDNLEAEEQKMKAVREAGGNGFGDIETKAVQRPRPVSPRDVSAAQWKQLFFAAKSGTPFRVEVDGKGDVTTKSAWGENTYGGYNTTGLFPPVLQPQLTEGLLYEPDRIFSHFVHATMDGPSISYIRHTSNTNPAAYVAELGAKPDIGPVLSTVVTSPIKVAALTTVSMEALHDMEYFMSWVPNELIKAVIDEETNLVLNGTGASGAVPSGSMEGILNTSGILTRAMSSNTPLDALLLGMNDLRTSSSYAECNLIAVHPNTLTFLRTQKDDYGRYLLTPSDSTPEQANSIWGIEVVQNTWVPANTAILFDTRKAILAWTRMGITVEMNPYGDNGSAGLWSTNAISFRAEERIAIGVQRPTAVNVITGLEA